MTASAAFESISGSGDDFQQVVAVGESLGGYCLAEAIRRQFGGTR